MEQLAVIEGHNGDQRAALLDAAREHAEAAVELVLVTTRRPEADDHGGLEHLAADSAERGMLRQVRVVNTSTPELRVILSWSDMQPSPLSLWERGRG